MAILGIESVLYGVDDLARCTRFWEDYGLIPVSKTEHESVFEVASGSRITRSSHIGGSCVGFILDGSIPPPCYGGITKSRSRRDQA